MGGHVFILFFPRSVGDSKLDFKFKIYEYIWLKFFKNLFRRPGWISSLSYDLIIW